MNNNELRELVHLLMMCGIMDKTATESGNVTHEEWLRMKNLIEKYQTEGGINYESDKSGDLISRDALKKEFEKVYPLTTNEMGGIVNKRSYDIIDNAPTVSDQDTIKELWNCRNELCLRCRKYKESHLGACDDCRYNRENMSKYKREKGGVK